MEEKKTLYRSSYRQTFSEFKHVSNEWMFVVGGALMSIAVALLFYTWFVVYGKINNMDTIDL